MKYVPLGSSSDIGASCHYLQIDGTGILLDTGVDPQQDGLDGLPLLDLVSGHSDRPVVHVMVTHAHHDHLGALPVVLKRFPHVAAHMTRATRDLADILLPASARLQERKQREGSSLADPIFTEDDAEASSYAYETHELESSFDVTGLRGSVAVRARFYDAGHVLGSAGILLEFENGNFEEGMAHSARLIELMEEIEPGPNHEYACPALGAPILARISGNLSWLALGESSAASVLSSPLAVPYFTVADSHIPGA